MSPSPDRSHEPNGSTSQSAPTNAIDAVLKPSDAVPEGATPIRGVDFNQYTNQPITIEDLISNMSSTGFQASAIADAVSIINDMVYHFSLILRISIHLRSTTLTLSSAPGVILQPPPARPSSSATPPISSPPDSARHSATSYNTSTSQPSLPPPVASKRT